MTPPQTLASLWTPVRSLESVLERRWARLLMPSLPDLFFLAILVWLFVSGAGGWQGLLADGDVGWHIRTGESILDQHAVPRRDPYSFSKPDAPWYAWEWGSDVIDALLHRAAGLKGVVLMAGAIIALFATTLVRRMMWRGAHLFIALVVALLGVGAASIHFLARPHLFTLLLLSCSMWILEADRRQPGRRIWWLAPLTAVWANLHGGFLVLILTLGVAAAGRAVEAWMGGRDWSGAFRYAGLTGACAAASLLNPYGWGLHRHAIEYLRSDWIRNAVQEFQSPSFRNENMMQFEALMLAGLIAAGGLFRRRRIVEGLWIVVFAHLSLASVRHVPVFVTVAAPVIACEMSGWWRDWTAGVRKSSLAGILNQMAADSARGFERLSVWPAAVVVVLAFLGRPVRWPEDFPDLLFPTRMVHAHAGEIFGARVLTTDQWGDYLLYTNPRQKVFIDGRSDFYGPEIGGEFERLVSGNRDWQQVMDKYRFTVALLPVESAITQLLKQRPEWRVAEDDGQHILLVRKAASVLSTEKMNPEPRF